MKGLFESQYKLANPGKPIPTEQEWEQIMDGIGDISIGFDYVQIGHCHMGMWKWHIPNCNALNAKQSMHVPAWERFDYIWHFVTNNIMWYSTEQGTWSSVSEPISLEFLTFLFMIDRYVWKKKTGFNY